MSKERDLLGRWHNGDLLPEEYMALMKETKELLAQPEQRLAPLTSKLISLGNNCHGSFIKGIRFAEKMHGIGGGE